jgi:hypothetical protein
MLGGAREQRRVHAAHLALINWAETGAPPPCATARFTRRCSVSRLHSLRLSSGRLGAGFGPHTSYSHPNALFRADIISPVGRNLAPRAGVVEGQSFSSATAFRARSRIGPIRPRSFCRSSLNAASWPDSHSSASDASPSRSRSLRNRLADFFPVIRARESARAMTRSPYASQMASGLGRSLPSSIGPTLNAVNLNRTLHKTNKCKFNDASERRTCGCITHFDWPPQTPNPTAALRDALTVSDVKGVPLSEGRGA